MSCTNPIFARYAGPVDVETGKRPIQILRKRLSIDEYKRIYGDDFLLLPCGKCKSCIEARSKSWALRCVLESSYYKENYFITLTYDEAHVTKGLVKKDLQDFIKRLRYYSPDIRYFACGEYGGKSKRPHFHLIVFNLHLNDLKFFSKNYEGDNYFISETIKKVWPFGIHTISDVTFKTCAYVARYCQKKLVSNQGEFSLMSRRPGIGYRYFEEHYQDFYKYDAIVTAFGSFQPCRYFDRCLESISPNAIDEIKDIRINNSNIALISDMLNHGFTTYEQELELKAMIKESKFKKLQRKGV